MRVLVLLVVAHPRPRRHHKTTLFFSSLLQQPGQPHQDDRHRGQAQHGRQSRQRRPALARLGTYQRQAPPRGRQPARRRVDVVAQVVQEAGLQVQLLIDGQGDVLVGWRVEGEWKGV